MWSVGPEFVQKNSDEQCSLVHFGYDADLFGHLRLSFNLSPTYASNARTTHSLQPLRNICKAADNSRWESSVCIKRVWQKADETDKAMKLSKSKSKVELKDLSSACKRVWQWTDWAKHWLSKTLVRAFHSLLNPPVKASVKPLFTTTTNPHATQGLVVKPL